MHIASHHASQAAQALFARQQDSDRKHHEWRLTWLAEGSPAWADGVPVSASSRREMQMASQRCLSDRSHGYNTGPSISLAR